MEHPFGFSFLGRNDCFAPIVVIARTANRILWERLLRRIWQNARHSYLSKSFRAPNFRRNNVAVNRVAIADRPQIVTAKKVDADIFCSGSPDK